MENDRAHPSKHFPFVATVTELANILFRFHGPSFAHLFQGRLEWAGSQNLTQIASSPPVFSTEAQFSRLLLASASISKALRSTGLRKGSLRSVAYRFPWERLSDEQLLDLRICDLPVKIKGSFLEPHIRRLYSELNVRGIRFKPHVWLSEEWFSPDGVPGIAIPFYLAHPRLIKLERKQMLEVEGGTDTECMRILRHEAGHALDTAFRLHFKRMYRELFGSFAQPYPDFYKPKPKSRRFVLHLPAWYAQAHPAEDFAETFAVWLTPRSQWRRRYKGWPALRKLEYIDEIMSDLAGTKPRNRTRTKVEPLSALRITLREHYRRKRERYDFEWPAVYDRDLYRIFSNEPRDRTKQSAASFIRKVRREVRQIVAEGTGVHQYTIDHVLQNMIDRCKELGLRVSTPSREARRRVMIVLTVQVMNVLHSGYHRIAV